MQAEADGYVVIRSQDRAGLVSRPPPPLAGPVKMPGTVHQEMSVQASVVVKTNEQVFADAVHPHDGTPGQVIAGKPRVAKLPTGQLLATKGGRQTLSRPVHRIALRHDYVCPDALCPDPVCPDAGSPGALERVASASALGARTTLPSGNLDKGLRATHV
jgi:hypothetical protein